MSLTRKHQAWLDLAVKLALTSTCRQQHGAVIVIRNSVLALGTNKFRNHPKIMDDFDHCSRHAETDALRSVIKRSSWVDLRKAVVYVARVGSHGTLRLSRPCNTCWNELTNAGIRTVVYTTDRGGVMERW